MIHNAHSLQDYILRSKVETVRYSQTLVEEEFLPFARRYDPEGSLCTRVSEYFDAWMREGNAVEETAGNHALFLQVFLLVANRFAQEPDLFGEARQHPVDQLLRLSATEEEEHEPPDCMNPDYWNLYVFRRKYGMDVSVDGTRQRWRCPPS